MAKWTPVIFIEWIDAHNNTGWYSPDHAREWAKDDWYCQDVGFLIHETKRHITFAQRHEPCGHSNGEEQWGGLHKIPKTWIRNRRVLGYMSADGGIAIPHSAPRKEEQAKPPSARRNRARKGKANGRKGT